MLEERPTEARTDAPARPTPPEVVVRVDQGRPRRRFVTGVLGGVAAVGLVAVLGLVGVVAFRGWSGLSDLFASKTIDRSAPVLVQRLRDRTDYTAATGTFSATVDIENKPVSIVPTFLAGNRTIYSGIGSADATVDLGALPRTPVHAADGALVIRLPHARVGTVHLDLGKSHVMSRDRGLVDRVESVFVDSPTSEREVQRKAVTRIEQAAVKSNLRTRAERNTERMIQDLARALGVGPVRVTFGPTAT